MTPQQYDIEAKKLFEAFHKGVATPNLSTTYPDMSLDDAYEIQLKTVEMAKEHGYRIVGKKIGLVSKAMQKLVGLDMPDYGHVYDSMVFAEEEPISVAQFNRPRIEPELAFILSKDLMGPDINHIDVINATECVVPCFEIIDSRYDTAVLSVTESISDNASAGGITLGTKIGKADCLDLRHIGMVLELNGEIIDTAAGAAVMGHPAHAVAWLANKLSEYGVALKKGEIILSGSLVKAIPVTPGDCFVVSFDGLGTAKAKFID